VAKIGSIAANNDLIFDGGRALEAHIRKETCDLLELNYETFQKGHDRFRIFPCDDYVMVSNVVLNEIEKNLTEARDMCANFVPINPVNAILARIEETTGVKTRLMKGACSHPVTLPAGTVHEGYGGLIFGTTSCCLCDENEEKKVNIVKNLNTKIREKMDTIPGPSPDYVLAFDRNYQLELREISTWNQDIGILKEHDVARTLALEFLEQRMGIQEKNESTRVQREDIISQKLLQLERNDAVRSNDISKLNKKLELLVVEISRLSQDKAMTNNQVAALTLQSQELKQEKVKMRTELSHLTDELYKVHQQKKLLNDIVGDLNKIIEDLADANKNLKKEIAFLKRAMKPYNPRLEFLDDPELERQMHLILKDSTFINENHYKFFSEILPDIKDASLIFSMKRHGKEAAKFHEKCDFKGATFTVIRSGRWIAGGFSDQNWDTSDSTKSSTAAFIFSYNRNRRYVLKSDQVPYAISCLKDNGPVFGAGGDLYVNGNFESCQNFSSLGENYDAEGIENPYNELFGSRNFFIEDMEVYQLKLKT
jgi:hypothetical protein